MLFVGIGLSPLEGLKYLCSTWFAHNKNTVGIGLSPLEGLKL